MDANNNIYYLIYGIPMLITVGAIVLVFVIHIGGGIETLKQKRKLKIIEKSGLFYDNMPLSNEKDFDNAWIYQVPINVHENEKVIKYKGIIEMNTSVLIKMQGFYYYKDKCKFYISLK